MKRLRYCVAVSLDGFIAGPDGECDWIIMDPSTDFDEFFKEFDTVLMGRGSYMFIKEGAGSMMPGMKTLVCSSTLLSEDHPEVTVVSDAETMVKELKLEPGKDIWLFGGGNLFRSLLDAGLVDTVEIGVMPILLSRGLPLLADGDRSPKLNLTDTKTLPSGIVGLNYNVQYQSG